MRFLRGVVIRTTTQTGGKLTCSVRGRTGVVRRPARLVGMWPRWRLDVVLGINLCRRMLQRRMSVVGVRSFRPADRAAVRDISYHTGFMGESAASFWRHKESWADLAAVPSRHRRLPLPRAAGQLAGPGTGHRRLHRPPLASASAHRPAPSGARYRVGGGADGAVAATAAGGRFTGLPSAHAGREHTRAQVLREVWLPQPRESRPGWGDAGEERGTAAPADHGAKPVIGSCRPGSQRPSPRRLPCS